MTITIDIHLNPEQGAIADQLDEAMLALGYERRSPTLKEVAIALHDNGMAMDFKLSPKVDEDEIIAAEGIRPETPDQPTAPAASTPTRERGKPSPGHARRTKAEIAEDDASEKAEAERNAAKAAGADEVAAISTGEERVGPEDDAATQEQDAADEAAETAAATDGKLTLDDVRNVLGLYVKGYGLPAAQEDGPKIIAEVCGGGKVKVSDVPDDKIAEVIAAVKAAGKANRFARTAVTA